LIKKAKELSILCDAEVALIIFSSTGKIYDFSSVCMEQILSRYGYTTASTEHKQQREHQLLICASHGNEAVLRNDDSMKGELERLQLAIEYVSHWKKNLRLFLVKVSAFHRFFLLVREQET
jgi:hypothetical protein